MFQISLFQTAVCQKNQNKNQSQLQRGGVTENQHCKTEFVRTHGN